MKLRLVSFAITLPVAAFVAAACGPTTNSPSATPTPASESPTTSAEPVSAEPLPATCSAEEGGESFKAMANEVVGGVRIGAATADVTANLGAPSSVEGPTPNEVEGGSMWTWTYDTAVVVVVSETTMETATVSSLTIKTGSDHKTRFGVGVGSTKSDVSQAYGPCIDDELSTDAQIIVGSVYGGVFFSIKDGLVSEIFVGAGAE